MLKRIPIGTPVTIPKTSIDCSSDQTVCLPPTSGVVIIILANRHHQLESPDCTIAAALNNAYPGLFAVRISKTDRLNSVVLEDPKNLLHSQLLVSLSHPTGYFSRNEKGLRVCASTGPIRTITSAMNEIVTTPDGTISLTFLEHAKIHAPQDEELITRWQTMPKSVSSRELAGMIPQAGLEAIYRTVAVLFGRQTAKPQQLSSHYMLFAQDLNADQQPDHFTPLPDLTMLLSKTDPSTRTRPKVKLTANSSTKGDNAVSSITPRSSKRKFIPQQSRRNWQPLPKIGSKEFNETLYNLWYLLQAFPVNAANLERLLASNPGVAGVPVGASRLLPYLPIDSRRLKFANMPSRPHSIDSYTDRELQNAPGSTWYLDIKHVTVKSIFGSLKYFYTFVEESTLATVAFPTATMTAEDTQAALSFLLHMCRTHYQVRPKVISTDAATNLNPAVLNHWKTQEDLTFTVLGRGRAHFTFQQNAQSIAVLTSQIW